MGYQDIADTIVGEKILIGPTFQKIDGTAIKLGDIGINESFGILGDSITVLDTQGGTKAKYYYVDEENATMFHDYGSPDSKPGWYDADEYDNWQWNCPILDKNEDELLMGECVMIRGATGAGLIFNGQVAKEDVEIKCPGDNQKNFRCNCTPVKLSMGEIKPNAGFGVLGDSITMIDAQGGKRIKYYYVDKENADMFHDYGSPDSKPGWYDADEYDNWQWNCPILDRNADIVNAGYGFIVLVGANNAGIVLKSPIPADNE